MKVRLSPLIPFRCNILLGVVLGGRAISVEGSATRRLNINSWLIFPNRPIQSLGKQTQLTYNRLHVLDNITSYSILFTNLVIFPKK